MTSTLLLRAALVGLLLLDCALLVGFGLGELIWRLQERSRESRTSKADSLNYPATGRVNGKWSNQLSTGTRDK